MLRRGSASCPTTCQTQAEAIVARGGEICSDCNGSCSARSTATRIRCHGDYHLGQVLYTGNDFVIIDFEGEPTRSISERQLEASPFRDVAGMIRSFDYACYSALADQIGGMVARARRVGAAARLDAILDGLDQRGIFEIVPGSGPRPAVPPSEIEESQILLDVYLLEKALYELRYELNNRPEWRPHPALRHPATVG